MRKGSHSFDLKAQQMSYVIARLFLQVIEGFCLAPLKAEVKKNQCLVSSVQVSERKVQAKGISILVLSDLWNLYYYYYFLIKVLGTIPVEIMRCNASLLQGKTQHISINLISVPVPKSSKLCLHCSAGYLIVLLVTWHAATYSRQIKYNHISVLKLHSFSIWSLWAIIMLLSIYLFPSRRFSD